MQTKNYKEYNAWFFKNITGYSEAVFTNGGSSAFHAFLLTQMVDQDDEIIFPVECYPTLPMAAIQCGLRPVFADVDKQYNLSPDDLKNKISPKTKFVFVIHMAGIPAQMEKINEILKDRQDIILVEDWCQALGTVMKGGLKKTARTSAVILSFSSSKLLSIDGGGLCLVDSAECAEKMRIIVNNGYYKPERFVMLGYSYYMHPLQDKLLFEGIHGIDKIIANHEGIFATMYDSLHSEFKPICEFNNKILQHKLVVQLDIPGFDFLQYDSEPMYKEYFHVGEFHYPVDIYQEKFITDFYGDGISGAKDFPVFNQIRKSYFAFRIQRNIQDYHKFMEMILNSSMGDKNEPYYVRECV